MSKEGNSDAAPPEGGDAGKKDDIYENQGTKKLIRLVTVMAYMFSVSFVAILLSAYYLFLWEPPNPRLIHRPNRLRADPQLQFLFSEPPVPPNRSAGHLGVFTPTTFAQGTLGEPTSLNQSQGPIAGRITGRIANDELDVRHSMGGQGIGENREKLNESLFVLRRSLIDILRGKIYNTTADRPPRENETAVTGAPMGGDGKTNSPRNFPASRGYEGPNLRNISRKTSERRYEKVPPVKMSRFTFGHNATSPRLESSTISGDEVNKDRFTGAPSANINQRDRGTKKFVGVNGEKASGDLAKKYERKRLEPSAQQDSTKNKDSIDGNIHRKEGNVRMFRNSSTSSSDGPSINSYSTMEETNISTHNGSGRNITSPEDGVVEIRKTTADHVDDIDLPAREAPGSAFNLRFSNRLEFPPEADVSSVNLTNAALISEDTQMERMTTKTMIVEDERLREAEIATTPRQKDLLTILTEATRSEEVFASTTTAVYEDLRHLKSGYSGSCEEYDLK